MIINACDLRTGSATRFGSRESGIWRLGRFADPVAVATAVAASAAYPLLLPNLDRKFEIERRDGSRASERVLLTDGGIFDNLGTSCLEPGRSEQYSYNVFEVEQIHRLRRWPGTFGRRLPGRSSLRCDRPISIALRCVASS